MAKSTNGLLSGTVSGITLTDSTPIDVYKIKVRLSGPIMSEIDAMPIDANIKRIPLIGEHVLVVKSTSPEK